MKIRSTVVVNQIITKNNEELLSWQLYRFQSKIEIIFEGTYKVFYDVEIIYFI